MGDDNATLFAMPWQPPIGRRKRLFFFLRNPTADTIKKGFFPHVQTFSRKTILLFLSTAYISRPFQTCYPSTLLSGADEGERISWQSFPSIPHFLPQKNFFTFHKWLRAECEMRVRSEVIKFSFRRLYARGRSEEKSLEKKEIHSGAK